MLENTRYSGADWIKGSLRIENMSPLGREVADFLGDLYFGIYHMNTPALRKVDWSDPDFIRVVISHPLATYDGDTLTRIAVLSHDRMLRVDIEPVNFRHMAMLFHKRKTRTGSIFERMPTMEEHIKMIRNGYSIKPK